MKVNVKLLVKAALKDTWSLLLKFSLAIVVVISAGFWVNFLVILFNFGWQLATETWSALI